MLGIDVPTRNPVVGAPPKSTIMVQTLGHRRVIPEFLQRATLKFQGIPQHLYPAVLQGILAQVQSDEVLVAAKGRREVCTTERGNRTPP